jgi:hypothetical protein
MFFDLDVGKTSGNYYFTVERHGRNYLAETGLRNTHGMFYPLSRSNTAFFDRDRPSGHYRTMDSFSLSICRREKEAVAGAGTTVQGYTVF